MILQFLVSLGLLWWIDVAFCQSSLSVSVNTVMWFLSLILFMSCITFIDFHMLTHSCIMVYDLFNCWLQFVNILLRISVGMFIKKIDLQYSLFVVCLSSFGIGKTGFIEWVCECCFPFHFIEEFEKHQHCSSLKVCKYSAMKLTASGLFADRLTLVLKSHCSLLFCL
jgi:hypothetical protein